MNSLHSVCNSALEQAVVSRNKEFLYTFLELQEETKEKMVMELSSKMVIPLLQILTELFERKEMRYEVISAIRSILSWRRHIFKAAGVDVAEKKEDSMYTSEYTETMNSLKKILIAINKEKVDLNKVYELKGRIGFIRDALEERKEEQENVPVCREQ